jgi:hypothetical protein
VPAHDADCCRDRLRPQWDRDDHAKDDPFHHRRLVGIGDGMTAMMSVPAPEWPSNLFADAYALLDDSEIDGELTVNQVLFPSGDGLSHSDVMLRHFR